MRIALAWELGGGMGHLARLSALARPLREAGHHARLVTARPPADASAFGSAFDSVGLAPPFVTLPRGRQVLPTATWADVLHNAAWAGGLGGYADGWAGALAGADVVVADYAPTALLAARRLGAACVTASNGFTRPPDASPPPDLLRLAGLARRRDSRSAAVEGDLLRAANAWLGGAGPLPRLSALFAGVPDVRTTFAELDHYGPREDGAYVGPLPQPPGVAVDWPEGGGPRVLAYLKLGLATGRVLGLLGRSGMPSLVHLRGATPRGLPARVRVTREPLDVAAAAAGADVAVCHAGPGFSTAALLAGVPVVALPQHLEQSIFARRLADAGLAAVADPDDAGSFRDALVRVLTDPAHAAAAAGFADRHRGHDARAAADRACAAITSAAGP